VFYSNLLVELVTEEVKLTLTYCLKWNILKINLIFFEIDRQKGIDMIRRKYKLFEIFFYIAWIFFFKSQEGLQTFEHQPTMLEISI